MAGRRPRVTRDEAAGQNPLRAERPYAPKAKGHANGAVHGMKWPRAIDDRAQAIMTAMLEDARCPDHLRSPAFAAEFLAWGQAEAVASLAWDYMCELLALGGPEAIFQIRPNVTKAQAEVWKGLAAFASQRRAALGISPVSYAKIARDLGIAAATTQDQLSRMSERGGEIARRRLGVVSGDG